MPGKVKVKIIAGRNLPVMDRSSDTTDAYVEIKLANTTYKTDVCRKSLHPQWNSEWYRFEVDDSELQDEPLQIRLMDHDTYSANDAIGKVYLDLNPLLLPAASLLKCKENALNHEHKPNSVMSGWIPVYDTMHGIRGEVNVIVKVELFIDSNKFRQSSCGVQFFCSPAIPQGFYAQIVHGFVEELVVNDDPEYQWIDKIRTPRASNEARQTLFFKLSGVLQRKIGVKALDLGGNAVIGYIQSFDLEGDSGIVARGIGTAVTLVKMIDIPTQTIADNIIEERAISYLKFLSCDKGFHLNKRPHLVNYNKLLRHVHPRHFSYTPRPTFEINKLNPDVSDPPKMFTRHLSQMDFTKVPQPVMQHSTSLQTLLKQEDMRGTPGTGISQRIKNLKYSSQNILSKKMTALKAKLSDVGTPEEGEEPKTTSATDLLDLKKKKSKFLRSSSDSNTMAELLVRSVIQVHSSLDCIMEAHDPPPAFQKQISLTESTNDNENTDIKAESFLSLPDASMDTHSSVTSEVSDSSSSDDDVSDAKDNPVDYDTISQIVKNVRKLSLFDNNTSGNLMQNFDALDTHTEVDSNEEMDDIEITDADLKIGNISRNVQPPMDDLNIFKEPWQFDTKADESEKKVLFTLGEDEVDTKSIPPIAESDNFSIHSSNDEINTIRSTQKDLDQEPMHDKLIFPPVMMGTNIESNGLMKTALQTLLLEKVNIIGSYTPPTSPVESNNTFVLPSKSTPPSEKDQSFFPKIAKTFESIRRSSSSKSLTPFELHTLKKSSSLRDISSKNKSSRRSILSLQDHQSHHVLGAPFTALNIKNEDIKRDRVDSDTSSDAKTTKTFLTKAEGKIRNVFQSPIAFLHNKNRESIKKKNEQKGLLGTALQNVLMETVNDILATSQGNAENKVPEKVTFEEKSDSVVKVTDKQEILPTSPVIVTSNSSVFDKNLIASMSANTEIEKGISKANNLHASLHPSLRLPGSPLPEYTRQEYGHQRTESVGAKMSHSPAKLNAIPCIHRRSSDSDLSITPKGNSLTGSDRSGGAIGGHFMRNNTLMRSTVPQENFDIMEYPFLTMSKYPPGFVAYMGGAVSARSVKLLERITNIEEPESRDTWWSEIRMEIRSHARALNCNAVLGYCETTSICDDVCVLSANGTAAIIGFQYASEVSDCVGGLPIIPKSQLMGRELMSTSLDRSEFEKDKKTTETPSVNQNNRVLPESPDRDVTSSGHSHNPQSCAICHLPYSGGSISLRSTVLKCHVCRTGKVPDVLIATIEMPEGIPSMGRGCFVESHVCRPLRDLKGESYAKEISDGLPFLEYELHRILVNKLKVKGMNAIFGLKVRVSIGEKMLIGMATGTAVFLSPLPPPPLPKLVSDRSTDERKLAELQKNLHDIIKRNKEIYQLKPLDDHPNGRVLSDTDDSEDEQTVLELALGNKDCCILEVDDPEDVEVVNLLMEARPPDGFHVVNTELVPGLEDLEIVKNLQMFIQIWRAKIQPSSNLDKHFQKLLETVYFKLRRMIPCALCDLQFRVDSPEPDEIQLCVLGMALGLGDPQKSLKSKRKTVLSKRNEDELIFNLEEDQIPENSVVQTPPNATMLHTQLSKHRQKSPQRKRMLTTQRHVPYRERHGVDITPLSYVPGGKIERYLGNLNFFFIRETTSIREEGGLSGFIHSFVTEVLAIVRAHVTALGGNAMVAYSLTECVLNHNLHKNQGQCLINVGGDVVYVSYFAEDQ